MTDADKKQFADALLKRLSKLESDDEQRWYLALVSTALDETLHDLDKSLEIADKAFMLQQSGPAAVTRSLPPLSRLKQFLRR